MIHRSRGTDYTAVAKGTAVAEDAGQTTTQSQRGPQSRRTDSTAVAKGTAVADLVHVRGTA